MPVEIEAKIKVDKLDSYASALEGIGADLIGDIDQKDTFFDEAGRRLLHSGCGLRIRRERSEGIDRTILCFKGPVDTTGNFKQRQEIELTVDSAESAEQLLGGLGFAVVMAVEKHRQMWRLGGCEVCLDRVNGLGCFVEIEGPGEEAISAVAGQLGLDVNQHIPKSYAHMLYDKQAH